MAEHILLTGATGFLGRAVLGELLAGGYDITAISRDPTGAKERLPAGIEVRGYDDLPDAVDAVIHLAGETPAGLWTPSKRARIYNSRVQTTRDLVAWMGGLSKAPHSLLCASALGIYGDRPGEALKEDASHDPTRGFRAKVCIDWEAEATQARSLGCRVVTLRIGNIMHPKGGYLEIMLPLYRYGLRFVWGDADGNMAWISRDDAASLIRFALERPDIEGPLHLSAPTPVSQSTFAHAVNRAYRRRVWGRIPRWLMRLLMGELARAITDRQHVVPAKALEHGFLFQDPEFAPYIEEVCRP